MPAAAFVVPFSPLAPCLRCTPLHHTAVTRRTPPRRPRPLYFLVKATTSPAHADDIAAAVAAQDTVRLPALFNAALSSEITSAPPSLRLFRAALSACIKARDASSLSTVLRLGLRFSELRSELRLPHIVPALRTLASAGRWRTVHACLDALWAAVPHAVPDARLLVELANVAVSRRALPQSLRLFAWMDNRSIPLGTVGFSVLLKTHGRATNVVAVRAAIVRLREESIPLDTILLNSAVDALVRCDDLAGARRLVAHPDAADLLDVTTFNTLLKGFANGARVDDAFNLAADMLTIGLSPNYVTTNTLLGACVAAREFDMAWRLVKLPRLERPGSEHPFQEDAEPPDQLSVTSPLWTDTLGSLPAPTGDREQLRIALTALLCGLAEAGHITEALAVLEDMRTRRAWPNSITYAALISACFRYGAVSPALQVFRTIPARQRQGRSPLRNAMVCNAVISGLCGLDDAQYVHKAAVLVRRMMDTDDARSEGSTPVLYARPNIATFNAMIDGYVRFRLFSDAERHLQLLHTQRLRPNVVTYTILMKGYADADRYSDAKRVFTQMKARKVEPDRVVLNAYVSICARSGDAEEAERVLRSMEDAATAVEARGSASVAPTAYSYSPLFGTYTRAGGHEAVWTLYARMRAAHVPVNAHVVELLCTYIAETHKSNMRTERSQDSDASDERPINISVEELSHRAVQVLKDGLADGVEVKVLRRCRRQVLRLLRDRKREKEQLLEADAADLRSASEKIFERHGWNEIESGWRVL